MKNPNYILDAINKFSLEIAKHDGEVDSITVSEHIYQKLIVETGAALGIYGNPGDKMLLNLAGCGPMEIKSSKKQEIKRLKDTIESAKAKLAKLEFGNE